MYSKKMFIVSYVALFLVSFGSTVFGFTLPEGAKKFIDVDDNLPKKSKICDPARSYWKAKLVQIQGKRDVNTDYDYATVVLRDPWDFDEDIEGFAGEGISELSLKEGCLHFKTLKQGASIYYGDPKKPLPGGKEPEIFSDEKLQKRLYTISMKIRIRQSLTESVCRIKKRGANTPASRYMHQGAKSIKLKGTDWQEIEIQFGNSWTYYGAYILEFEEPDNTIDIDYIKIYTPTSLQVYRYNINIPEEIHRWVLSFHGSPAVELYINNKLAKKRDSVGARELVEVSGTEGFFHKGENVIVVCKDTYGRFGPEWDFFLQGGVQTSSGQCLEIISDAKWKGNINPSGNYLKLNYDDSTWQNVKEITTVNQSRYPGFGRSRMGYYLNPQYFGPINVYFTKKNPVFYDNEEIKFEMEVPHKGGQHFSFVLENTLEEKMVEKGTIDLDKGDLSGFVKGSWQRERLPAGVYELTLELKEQESLEKRVIEFLVAGSIKQHEIVGTDITEGLKLKLVDEIDCVDPKKPMLEAGWSSDNKPVKVPTHVVIKPFGKYRETEKRFDAYFSFPYEVENLDRPHLMVVEYPDDAERVMAFRIHENTWWQYIPNDTGDAALCKAAPGVFTGFEYPISNQMKKAYSIFYPGVKIQTATVINCYQGGRAAASKISIYEIENDLPAMKIENADERLIGQHAERGPALFLWCLFAGEEDQKFSQNLSRCPHRGYYLNWYKTVSNLIKYMRFCGENLYTVGVWMYHKAYYPPSIPEWDLDVDAQVIYKGDYLELMAMMFEANNMKLLLNIEFAQPVDRKLPPMYTREGIGVQNWCSTCDPLLPEAQEAMKKLAGDLAFKYGKYPSIKGLVFPVSGCWNPGWSYKITSMLPLDSGYGDYTIDLFEKDTGIKVPVDKNDPKRFEQRYAFLTSNKMLEKWIDWRNKTIYQIRRDINQEVKNYAPAWNVYYFMGDPLGPGAEALYWQKGLDIRQLYRQYSTDSELYKKETNSVLGGLFMRKIRDRIKGSKNYIARRALECEPDFWKYFGRAIFLFDGFFEMSYYPPEDWFWASSAGGDYCVPSGRNALDYFVQVMRYGQPEVILHGLTDVNIITGYEDLRREFNQAYLSLPKGDYKLLQGNGLDKNIVVKQSKEKPDYYYMINLFDSSLTVELDFNQNVSLNDLTNFELQKADRFKKELKPYQIVSFKVEPVSAEIERCTVSLPEELVEKYRVKCLQFAEMARKIDEGKTGGDERKKEYIEEFKEKARRAEEGMKEHNLLIVKDNVASYRAQLLDSEIKGLVLGFWWTFIGPFDNEKSQGFDKVYSIEKDVLEDGVVRPKYKDMYGSEVEWKKVLAVYNGDAEGYVNMGEVFPGNLDWVLGYGITRFYVPEAQEAKLLIGSDDGIKIWLNKKEVFSLLKGRVAAPGQDEVIIELKKGWNELFIKHEEQIGNWEFYIDIKDNAGGPLRGLEFWRIN